MINSVSKNTSAFWITPQNIKLEDVKKQKIDSDKTNFGNKKDPLNTHPLRLCAYTNEVGAALAPIPVIGPKLFMLSWVPALMYFGADIYDKYAKGVDGDYSEPSRRKAAKQATFQALASVLLPTGAVILGQNVASSAMKFISKDKLDIRAKEDVLNELKRDLNQEKLRKYRKVIHNLIKSNPDMSVEKLAELDKVKKIKTGLTKLIYEEIKIESASAKRHREAKNPIKKFFSFFAHSHQNCEFVSRIKDAEFESKVKPYLAEQVSQVVNERIMLQRAMNADGTLNEHASKLGKGTLKKVTKLIERNKANRDIVDKSSFVVKECVISKVNKTAMRISVPKIVGGFAALALLATPIDHFVHNKVIPKLFGNKH